MDRSARVFLDGMEKPTRIFLVSAARGRSEDTGTENVRTKAGNTTDWESRVRSRGCRLGWLSQDREVETLLRFLRTVCAELALPDWVSHHVAFFTN